MGDVTGIFAAPRQDIEAAIGKRVCFGEILGKHSDIEGTLDWVDFEHLTDDPAFIEQAKEMKCIPTGYNPLDYLEESK